VPRSFRELFVRGAGGGSNFWHPTRASASRTDAESATDPINSFADADACRNGGGPCVAHREGSRARTKENDEKIGGLSMTSEQRAHDIVSAVLDMCGVELVDKRPSLEAFITGHLDEVERRAAEKAVAVYRQKTTEAGDKVLTDIVLPSLTE